MLSKLVRPEGIERDMDRRNLGPTSSNQNQSDTAPRVFTPEEQECLANFRRSVEKVEEWRIKCGFPPSTNLPKY